MATKDNKGKSASGKSASSASGKERGGSGNFANDPKRASEEGKKGGHASHGGSHAGR